MEKDRKRHMKRLIISLSLLLMAATSFAQQIPDSWKGRWWESFLEAPMLPVNLSMQKSTAGWSTQNAQNAEQVIAILNSMTGDSIIDETKPMFFSPLQSTMGIPADEYSFSGDTLRYFHRDLNIRMTLVYNPADSTFSGTFRQNLLRQNIVFTPCDTLTQFKRPQTPQSPYSFYPEHFILSRKDRNGQIVELGGTIAIPKGIAPGKKGFPAVVLVSGSGQQNRDEEIFLHKPFLVIAEHFARQGIATLRYDDRGVGNSRGDYVNATTYDYADDAEFLFNYLRRHDKIDGSRVGILGHSEGGSIAPMIAARNKKVAFVVMMAGSGCKGSDILLQQNEALFLSKEVPDSLIQVRLAIMHDIFNAADSLPESQYQQAFSDIIVSHNAHLTKEQQKAIEMRRSDSYSWAGQMQAPWIKSFIHLDPARYLPKVKCPVMAINGGKDIQVLPKPNLAAVEKLLPKNDRNLFKLYPSLNHLFQNCQRGDTKEYIYIEQTIAPEVLDDMSGWILKNITK